MEVRLVRNTEIELFEKGSGLLNGFGKVDDMFLRHSKVKFNKFETVTVL